MLVALCLGSASAQSAAAGPQPVAHTLVHGGLTREYLLHVPPGVTQPAPLVVALHGRGGDGAQMAAMTGFTALAERLGFVVLFPSGMDQQWNYVQGVPGYQLEVDDVGFIVGLAQELAAAGTVDPNRMYVTGFSNGGFMAQLLACQVPDVFAAFASVGAAGYGGQPGACGPPRPTSVLFVHGTHDAAIPWEGLRQETPQGMVTLLASVSETMAFWAQRLGCSLESTSSLLPNLERSPATRTQLVEFQGCPAGTELRLVAVQGGGHNWPGHPGVLPPQVAGNVSTDFDASELIYRFFERHALQ